MGKRKKPQPTRAVSRERKTPMAAASRATRQAGSLAAGRPEPSRKRGRHKPPGQRTNADHPTGGSGGKGAAKQRKGRGAMRPPIQRDEDPGRHTSIGNDPGHDQVRRRWGAPSTKKADRGPAWLVTILDHFGFETTVEEEVRLVKVFGRYLALNLALVLAICVLIVVGLALLTDRTLGGHIDVLTLIAVGLFSSAAAPAAIRIRRYLKNRQRPDQSEE